VAADAVINVLAHEIEESTTDYALNAWFDLSGQENADKCAWNFGATYSNGTGTANMKIGTKDFLIQQNWVNSGNGGCLQSFGGVTNQPPVAAFTYSCTNLVCNFDGTSSTDDVGIVSWLWTAPNGSTIATTPTFSHTFPAATTVNLTLKVTDGGGLSNSITKQVVVTSGPPNQPPVASWTFSCTPARVCTFDGTASFDPDGTIASYSWKAPNGTVLATTATFSKTFTGPVSGNVTLTVTDNGGLTNSLTKAVVVP
jgi:PKD repeat protein